ncbi:hypothetical protein [Saccharopolyspora spinosa]|uniref:hypothetical protein n=1 Tax=Saccharopolyspora spinosa TaxID=60894 RepID=UPI002351E796|nr:hypothetical protein [Saccharopolyspora spinosa]
MKEQGPLAVEQEAELAEFQAKVVQQKQKKKEGDAKRYQARKAAAARVVELEALAEQGPVLEELAGRGRLTVEQEAELAELQPKAEQWQKKKEGDAARSLAGKVAADRVSVLEVLAGRGRLLLLGLFPGVRVMAGVGCSRRRIRRPSRTRVRSGNRNRRRGTRSSTRR